MKERGIIFSAPMVRALLAGTKTQTRRMLKVQPTRSDVTLHHTSTRTASGLLEFTARDRRGQAVHAFHVDKHSVIAEAVCPYGAPGDRLWVRETHCRFVVGEGMDRPVPECVAYRATTAEDGTFDYVDTRGQETSLKVTKWTPAIHMPRWASRILLEVTEVRAERLHEITREDAIAEGCGSGELQDGTINGEPGRVAFFDPVYEYAHLWAAINGDDSWKANPWVWAVSFTRVETKR